MPTSRRTNMLLLTTGVITMGVFVFAITAAGADGWRDNSMIGNDPAGGVVRFRGGSKAVVAIVQDTDRHHEFSITNLDGPDENYRKQMAGDLMLYTWTPKRDARYRIVASGGQINWALYNND